MRDVKTAKQELLEMLDRMPDDSSMDELLYRAYFVAGVLRGLDDIARGDVLSNEEVQARVRMWNASGGRDPLFKSETETS